MIKIHIVLPFPFIMNLHMTFLLTSGLESGLWEHSISSVSKCSVVFRIKATIRAEPSYNPTCAYTDLGRTWVKNYIPVSLSNYTK